MKYLVTGSSGFIGMHVCQKLLKSKNNKVLGIDNHNEYYDIELKKNRNNLLKKSKNFIFKKTDLTNKKKLYVIFKKYKPEIIINLAAQAGVRYSIKNPKSFINSNIVGFQNILDLSRDFEIKHLVYASTSSVYGKNTKMPFKEYHSVDHPISLYAATKRANELMAHCYSSLFKLRTTGLRFFTVYGPWGRPDMALFLFTKDIINNKKIKIFNNGIMFRDFTYVEDIADAVVKISKKFPKPKKNIKKLLPDQSDAPFRIFNIGRNKSENLMNFIKEIEKNLGKTSKKTFLNMQLGDVKKTHASTRSLYKWIGYKPNTSIKDGIKNFINWYLNYYKIKKI